MDPNSPSPPSAEFVNLLTELQPDLWAYTISLMPGNSEVQDVIQKINVTAWQKQADFEIGTNFRAWIFTITRFEVMAHLRKSKNNRVIPLDQDLLELLSNEAIQDEPEHTPDTRLQALELCMERLKPNERALLYHRYNSDRPLSEFNRRSASSLSVTLHRIRIAIRKCIKDRLAIEGRTT